VEAIHIRDASNVDLGPDATVCGFELLNTNDQLQASDDGTLVVVNAALGDRPEVPLAVMTKCSRQEQRAKLLWPP
jgi:hypothetical protein